MEGRKRSGRDRWRLAISRAVNRRFAAFLYRRYFAVFATAGARALGIERSRIWFRNSLSEGAVDFLMSDIDVSVLLPAGADPRRLRRIRAFFPLVQEINWIHEKDLPVLLSVINPLELSRDPGLQRRAGASMEPTSTQKLIFLLRMFEVQGRWNPRKMAGYFRHAHPKASPRSFEDPESFLRDAFAEWDEPAERDRLRDFAVAFFHSRKTEPAHVFLERMPRDLCLSLFIHRFAFDEGDVPPLSPALGTLLAEQLKWELWGLTVQFPELEPAGLEAHLRRLMRWIESLSRPESRGLMDACENLLQRFPTERDFAG